jgi:DNA-binding transcriptional LysR family regulator
MNSPRHRRPAAAECNEDQPLAVLQPGETDMNLRPLRSIVVLALCALPSWADVRAQEPADTTQDALFVFNDCNARNCDFDHFRREITWINWVRDREDSDVHMLVTAQQTGGGGWTYTVDYIGRRNFEGINKSL